ncbi:PAS domain S-box-containing protein [Paucidesulfovibrio gracilis DSM 16080]|uniref:histidine kinase n=1 Tax=Paucidesulfovibrio gracilis DSM 16080 TaxID=1121449 RepID=A0A1T4XPC3_9BACT|nr:transporter substrate-binding domain-containing protein [Paucidesulfovibrio gracilis]SKA90915.1 PAS domain S-box-containing protein [Paucidesulfovibrio gracilis DSM 16080]
MPRIVPRIKVIVFLLSLLLAGLLYVLFLGVQNPAPDYTAQERDWLRLHGDKLEILSGYQAPPNAYTDDKGRYVGLLVDYFREIESNIGVSIRFRMFETWEEMMVYSRENGGFLVVGIAETAERRKHLKFTKPFLKVPYIIVVRDSSNVQTMADLRGKTVCTVSGYAVNEYLEQRYPEISVAGEKDNLAGLRAVASGKYEAMIVNQAYASYLIEEQALTNLRLSGDSGYINYLSAATSRTDDMLFSIVSKAVDHIPEDRHRELFREWVYRGPGYVHLTEQTVNFLWAAFVLVVASGVLFWVLLQSLRATVRRQTVTIRQDYERLKSAEQALREQESQLRNALERLTFHVHNTPLGVIEWDSEGRVKGWSPRAEAIFGWTESEVIGKRNEDWLFTHEQDMDEVRKGIQSLLHGGVSQTMSENRNYAKDGSVLHCRWYNSALRDTQGRLVSVLSLVENITEGKKSEKELIRAKNAAEAASAAKSEFLANMSHEIRTPLNGIQGMLQLLQTTGMSADQEEYVEKAIGSTRRLGQLLADVLHLALLEAGKVSVEHKTFQIRTVFEAIRELYEPTARDRRLHFHVHCDEHIAENVVGDAVRLRQLLMHLVGNAVKFTPVGGRVAVRAEALPSLRKGRLRVLLHVGDNGVGMTDKVLESVVTRLKPTKRCT